MPSILVVKNTPGRVGDQVPADVNENDLNGWGAGEVGRVKGEGPGACGLGGVD